MTREQLIIALHNVGIVKDNKLTHSSRYLFKQHPDLLTHLANLTSYLFCDQKEFKMRWCALLLNLQEHPKCKTCNNIVQLSRIKSKGYCFADYCSKKCINRKEVQKKVTATNIARHGTPHPRGDSHINEKAKQTMVDRYGCEFSLESEQIKSKFEQTMIERYGTIYPLQNKQIKQKLIDHNINKFGGPAPICDPSVKNKIEQTNTERYGVKCVFSSETIQVLIKSIHEQNLNVDNPSKSPLVRQRLVENNIIKYGVPFAAQSLYSSDTYQKLHDRDWMYNEHHINGHTLNKIGKILNVSSVTVGRCMKMHNISVNKIFGSSQGERDIRCFIEQMGVSVVSNSRSIIPPYELDIYVPSHNLAIEYNGIFWHSEQKGKDKNYHIKKTQMCYEKGIKLIHIFDYEWYDKRDLIESFLCSYIKPFNNFSSLFLQEMNFVSTKEFIEDNSIEPFNKHFDRSYALVCNQEITSVLTLTKNSIVQICNKMNTNILYALSVFKQYLLLPPRFEIDRRWYSPDEFTNLEFVVNTFVPPRLIVIGNQTVYDCGTIIYKK